MIPARWEVGSSFPLVIGAGDGPPGWLERAQLYGSGRQALTAVLDHGRRVHGWTAVHLPSYYCPDVVERIRATLPVRRYPASPIDGAAPQARAYEVVVATAFFGQRPEWLADVRSAVIVDATHDPFAPWLADLDVDYVASSLRKCLPLPDGGVAWSPRARSLPPALEPGEAVVTLTLSAMALKAAYLDGHSVDKDVYLGMFRRAEVALGTSPPAGMSEFSRAALRSFPVDAWRRRRLENIATLTGELAGVRTIPSTFGAVLRLESETQRNLVRSELISHGVYPAVLWDLGDAAARPLDRDLSATTFVLHTDFRYDADDMRRVGHLVTSAVRPRQLLESASC
jgi:hypothetical protein